MDDLTPTAITAARQRIEGLVHPTPVLVSHTLNHWLGHEVYFKAECLQKVGAFKARGALNALLAFIETHGRLPERVIANSSGNHAQAVAWACRERNIPCTIYMPEGTSAVKQQATRHYGAELVRLADRALVDAAAAQAAQQQGVFWIPPYNHPWVIAGQGTAAAEAFESTGPVHVIAAPCGGGGLLSGTLIAARAGSPSAQVIGVEPAAAADAWQSRKQGTIITLSATPDTMADGARTLSLGSHTFPYIQQLDDLITCSETRIAYWTQWLTHLLKVQVEPTAALGMEGAWQWLRTQDRPRRALVILSGGNLDAATRARVWSTDWLTHPPEGVLDALPH